MAEKILALDFDGVVHSYTSGWKGADVIPDPPVPGALEFIVQAAQEFEVHIFSSRSHQPGGIAAMQAWLLDAMVNHRVMQEMDSRPREDEYFRDRFRPFVYERLRWPTEKPPAFVTIDDRALTFTGEWPAISDLLSFKPWNKK